MATTRYVIKHTTLEGTLYIHFNPDSGSYFASNQLKGAAVFYRGPGEALIKDADLGDSWKLEALPAPAVIHADKSEEGKYFKATH